MPIQKVKKLPEGINGLCCYRISCDINDVKSRVASLKDGRRWKKDSRTEWAGYGRVRYANCKGSYRCANNNCMYLVEYGVVNSVQFKKIDGQLVCSLCHSIPEFLPCSARRYLVIMRDTVTVYHYGDHTCHVKPSSGTSETKEDVIKEYLRKNPDAKPTQVLYNLRTSCRWFETVRNGQKLTNKRKRC